MRTRHRAAIGVCAALAAVMFSPELPAQDVRALKESKDVPGLMRLLRNCDGRVRSSAAVVLSGVIRQIDDEKTLARHIQPLIDATLRDPYSSVREYAGRALQHCLQNVTDASVMAGAAAPLIDALNATEVDAKRRRYCAVQLSRVIPHVQQDSLLEQSVPMLLSATLNDPDETVREYAGRALKNALTRVSDTKLLHTGCVALARTHKHKDPRRRGYAAVLLSWLASRVKELDTLRAILDPIRNAAERDSNETVREYAGRATRDITRRLEAADAESNGPAKP